MVLKGGKEFFLTLCMQYLLILVVHDGALREMYSNLGWGWRYPEWKGQLNYNVIEKMKKMI